MDLEVKTHRKRHTIPKLIKDTCARALIQTNQKLEQGKLLDIKEAFHSDKGANMERRPQPSAEQYSIM